MGCAHGEERPAGVTGENSPRREPRHKAGHGYGRGGEELALLVVKTAPASGMKNTLALVVKNGLPPMVKNALASVTDGAPTV